MKTNLTEKEGRVVLSIEGDLDTDTCARFRDAIAPLMASAPAAVEIDMSKLEYISSKALRILISLQQHVTEQGGKLEATHVSPAIREIFDMTGLTGSFIPA